MMHRSAQMAILSNCFFPDVYLADAKLASAYFSSLSFLNPFIKLLVLLCQYWSAIKKKQFLAYKGHKKV